MSQRVRLMVIQDAEPHDIPDGWFLFNAVALRTTGVHATVALILVETVTEWGAEFGEEQR